MQASHQNKFDLLRGIASIAVLVPHIAAVFLYRLIGSDHPIASTAGTVARHAVLVFFLLSGYLITLSIFVNVQRNGRFNVAEYLTARVARIYPPLLGAIGIVLAAFAIIHGLGLPGAEHYGLPGDLYAARDRFTVSAKDVLFALLMHNGMLEADGPLWSLCIEFNLYIAALFAALAVTASTAKRRLVTAAAAIAWVAWWIRADSQFVFYLAIWALGASLCIWRALLARPIVAKSFSVLAWTSLGIYLALLFLAPGWLVIDKPGHWASFGLQFIACVGYAYVLFVPTWGERPPRWLARSGDYSYSLYVIHFPILLLILSLTQTWMGSSLTRACIVAALSGVIAIAASSVFSTFFENQRLFRPFIRSALGFVLRSEARVQARN